MSAGIKRILSFPRESATVTSGILLQDRGLLFTGHANGLVVEWELRGGKHRVLYDCGSTVESISAFSGDELVVGCISGLLLTIPTASPEKASIIQEATNTKYDRVWRVLRPEDEVIITSSTYGVLNLYQKVKQWKPSRLSGHGNSVFGLASLDGRFISSGDYRGNIVIREGKAGNFRTIDSASATSSVEAIAWRNDGGFATIGASGQVSFFEHDPTTQKWRSVFETDTASSRGRAIHFTADGSSVFAGTDTEIIQFDLDSQQVQLMRSSPTRAIFSSGNTIYVLTVDGLYSFERAPVIVPENLLKYKYAKVSLIGLTSVGKTRLVRSIVGMPVDKIQSTFGRETLDWVLPNGAPERRIIFHDHGGQETVLETFLPFLTDSDVIVVLYKQTDRGTYEKATRILDEIESITPRKPKVFFVQTHTDQDMNEVKYEESAIQKLVKSGRILGKFELSSVTGSGLSQFRQGLEKAISWDNARTMLQSQYTEGLLKVLAELKSQRTGIVSVNDIKAYFERNVGLPISKRHLQFLLLNFSNQGRVEYYPEALNDAVIMNDEKYNRLRSEIPIFVKHKQGIVPISQVERQFGSVEYIKVLDEVYRNYGVSIEFNDLRIFPGMLKERIDMRDVPEHYRRFLDSPLLNDEREFKVEKIDISTIFQALSELKLACIDASRTEGIFAWEVNACMYYQILESGTIGDRRTKIRFSVGGGKEAIVKRLASDFSSIIERLYGPSEQTSSIKKKLIPLNTT
jgi:GTPase SAR1 family protein